jgi:hypothetical protein
MEKGIGKYRGGFLRAYARASEDFIPGLKVRPPREREGVKESREVDDIGEARELVDIQEI